MAVEFDDLYDEGTLGRLARHDPTATRAEGDRPGWRTRTAGGVVATALALGLREVFDPPPEDPIVEEVDTARLADHLPVTVVLVPGAPALSWATVRPWLMRR